MAAAPHPRISGLVRLHESADSFRCQAGRCRKRHWWPNLRVLSRRAESIKHERHAGKEVNCLVAGCPDGGSAGFRTEGTQNVVAGNAILAPIVSGTSDEDIWPRRYPLEPVSSISARLSAEIRSPANRAVRNECRSLHLLARPPPDQAKLIKLGMGRCLSAPGPFVETTEWIAGKRLSIARRRRSRFCRR